MNGQPDAAPQAEPRSYALEGLRGLQSEVPQLTRAMVLCRARVEQHRNTDLAAARDDYNELHSARKRLADALSNAQLLLLEAEEYQLAANAGLLKEGLLGFDLLSNVYRPVYDALNGFAAQLPVDGTTNAQVVGPENWYNDFKPWHGAGGKDAQLCGISIRFGDEWITKWDGAEDSDIEPVKGGLSDSMKRAAVQWGVGRVLYNMDVVFVDVEKRGKTWCIKKDQQQRLDCAYLRMLGKLGLTPAPAGGLRPQTEPEGGENPAGQGKPAEQASGKPAGGSKTKGAAYIIRQARINKGMNSGSTLLRLESSKGDKLDAFVRGEHPELAVGVILANVKLEKRQKDTIIYYMLEQYEIMDAQPKAA